MESVMKIKQVSPSEIKPHPLNEEVYGDSYNQELLDSIRKDGILTPLRISKNNEIISGHRRHAVAKDLELDYIPVIVSDAEDDLTIRYEVIASNRQREKTNEQKAREFQKLKEIETEFAKQRQAENARQNQPQSQNQEKFPDSDLAQCPYCGTQHGRKVSCPSCLKNKDAVQEVKGQARDKAAEHVGLSGKSAEAASKVVEEIDRLESEGRNDEAEALKQKLNKSISGANKEAKRIKQSDEREELSEPPAEERKEKPKFNLTNENIDWAKWSWNPVTGCKHGCQYCYARDIANRFFDHGFEPMFYPERLEAPVNTKVPAKEGVGWKNVFVCSMGDLFGDWVEEDWINKVMEAVEDSPQWNFLFLTKNPKRLTKVVWPDNAWVGTTVDCQDRVEKAEETFQNLVDQNNKPSVTFISFEPLKEPININLTNVDWVIIGGQSKSTGEPAEQPLWEWVESLHNQARQYECDVYWKPNLSVKPKEYPTT